jgi:light-regulated signal transduction histidine kinase (bacteriophytochrome)
VRKDGTRFCSNWVLTAIRDSQGKLKGYSKVARDVTQLKQAQEKVARWNAELEQRVKDRTEELEAANKELEAFSYSVSHDLRAPLRRINAFVRLLEQDLGDKITPRAKSHFDAVADSAKRMGQLVDDLPSFSRLGRQDLIRVPVKLNALVREALQELQAEIVGRDIEWIIGDLPTVRGDPAALRQVVINLLSNAIKYSASRARARIEIGANATPEEFVCYVRDNGVGFDMNYADKLFGVFQRLHSAREFEGTGIGLAIVRRVIQRHGGRTWAEAEVNRGATFYFTLPNSSR